MRSNGSLRTWKTDLKNWTTLSLACGKTKTTSTSSHVHDHAVSVKKAAASVGVSTDSGEATEGEPPKNSGTRLQLLRNSMLKNSNAVLAIKYMRVNFFI